MMSSSVNGIVFDIKRFAVHDGPGIRTTIFFKGCPLKCAWCHNPESIAPDPVVSERKVRLDDQVFFQPELVGKSYPVEELLAEVMKDQVFWEESGGGVTFSGGEPLMQYPFAEALLKAFRAKGVHVAIDTCGFASLPVFKRFVGEANLFLFDLKLISDTKHQMFTGVSNLPILTNFRYAIGQGASIRVRIPVVPGVNFNGNDLTDFLNFLIPVQKNIQGIDLLPYHNIAAHKYERFKRENRMPETTSLSKDELKGWKNRFETVGFEVKIGG